VKAVSAIFPALLAGYGRSGLERPAVVLYPSDAVRRQLESEALPECVRLQVTGRPVAASAVLTSSGTMSMHCALAGIPGAIAYRTDPFTYLVARWIVRVEYLGIANILLGEPMYPEYIQGASSAEALAGELSACVGDPARLSKTHAQSDALRALLSRSAADNESGWLSRNLR
jgi:lipid-A-disaccharide synthase